MVGKPQIVRNKTLPTQLNLHQPPFPGPRRGLHCPEFEPHGLDISITEEQSVNTDSLLLVCMILGQHGASQSLSVSP